MLVRIMVRTDYPYFQSTKIDFEDEEKPLAIAKRNVLEHVNSKTMNIPKEPSSTKTVTCSTISSDVVSPL